MAGHAVQEGANEDPRSGEPAPTSAPAEPVAGSPIRFISKNDAEGDIIQAAIASIGSLVSIGQVIVGGKSVEDKEKASSPAPSSDGYLPPTPDEPRRERGAPPWEPWQLPEVLQIDDASLQRAVEQLQSRRILVIECIDGDVQRRAVRRVLDALGCGGKIINGVATDAAYAEDPSAVGFVAERSRWTIEWIVQPDLGERARVLLLEVNGAFGSRLVDRIFASQGSMEVVGNGLKQVPRYLFLLPRGGATDSLFGGHARRGFAVDPLRISFLRPWLDKRFPERAAEYETALRAQLARGDWGSKDTSRGQATGHGEPMSGGEQALYEWLCSLPNDHRGEEQIRQAVLNGVVEPRPLHAVKEALDRDDIADEILLTVVFAAAYFPRLTPSDFFRVVETLLAGRTRAATPAAPPASSTEAGPAVAQATEVSLLSEWQRTKRRITKEADLGLDIESGKLKAIRFRDGRAPTAVKDLLGSDLIFLDAQIERLYDSELLFDRSRAISDAVIKFIAGVAAEDPGRLNARWMLGLLIRSRPDTRHVPDLPATSELHGAEWVARHLDRAFRLLRGLIDAAPDSTLADHTPDGLATVNGVLDHLLFRMPDGSARIGLALAYMLRNEPGFDLLHWIRQAMERGRDPVKEGADELVRRLIGDPNESHAAFKQLFKWLPSGEQSPNGPARLAARTIANCLVVALRYTPSTDAARTPALTEFLCKAVIRGGDRPQIADIVTACFHPLVCALAIGRFGLDAWLTSLLQPDPAAVGDGVGTEQQGSDLAATWTEVTQELVSGFEENELAAQLPVALVLALWGHAYASQPAVAQALALAVRDKFVDGLPAIQIWLGTFDDVMSRCEDLAMSDRAADGEARDRWVQASMIKRQVFLDLQRWVAHGVADSERVWMS